MPRRSRDGDGAARRRRSRSERRARGERAVGKNQLARRRRRGTGRGGVRSGGLEGARELVPRDRGADARGRGELGSRDPKSPLQERVQARGLAAPTYRVIGTRGPQHDPVFEMEVMVGDASSATAKGNRSAPPSAPRRSPRSSANEPSRSESLSRSSCVATWADGGTCPGRRRGRVAVGDGDVDSLEQLEVHLVHVLRAQLVDELLLRGLDAVAEERVADMRGYVLGGSLARRDRAATPDDREGLALLGHGLDSSPSFTDSAAFARPGSTFRPASSTIRPDRRSPHCRRAGTSLCRCSCLTRGMRPVLHAAVHPSRRVEGGCASSRVFTRMRQRFRRSGASNRARLSS